MTISCRVFLDSGRVVLAAKATEEALWLGVFMVVVAVVHPLMDEVSTSLEVVVSNGLGGAVYPDAVLE